MTMFFTQIYIYDNNNKNIYILKYKKSLLHLLFEKSGKNIEIGLALPLPLFVFIRSLRTPLPPPQRTLY